MGDEPVTITATPDGILISKQKTVCVLCHGAENVIPLEIDGNEQLICRKCIAFIKRFGGGR